MEVVHWDFWQRVKLPFEGKVITIVGTNGSGKTTLLDALRTLLCIDCSSGRDYKRYVRRNNQPFAWLRAVVSNQRGKNGVRLFFPILGETVTLVCRIQKKGGDWERQYLIAEGDVQIESLADEKNWLGVREYQRQLEGAGLSQSIRHVLALEQGATDKLCDKKPTELLKLVFDAYGEQEILDNYQSAKNNQALIRQELDSLEMDLANLGIKLRLAEENVRSYQMWKGLKESINKLRFEILPRVHLAEMKEQIRGGRSNLRGQRRDVRRGEESVNQAKSTLDDLEKQIEQTEGVLSSRKVDEKKALDEARQANTNEMQIQGILEEKSRLENLCREQKEGVSAHELVNRQECLRQVKADKENRRSKIIADKREAEARLTAVRSGGRDEPHYVQQFRKALDDAKIKHSTLADIVDIKDDAWQAAVEGIIGGLAHVILLDSSKDEKAAWELSESMKYRHYATADKDPIPQPRKDSLLEAVNFSSAAPRWIVEHLDSIQRVETVDDGVALPTHQSWITRKSFFRERRGGRYVGVERKDFLFGRSARIAALEDIITRHLTEEKALIAEIDKLVQQIDDIQRLLQGWDAAAELKARAAVFAHAETEWPEAQKRSQELAVKVSAAQETLRKVEKELRQQYEGRGIATTNLDNEQKAVAQLLRVLRANKEEQVARIQSYRQLRKGMPLSWKSREAVVELKSKYPTTENAKAELQLAQKEIDGRDWVTDEQVVFVHQKIKCDHSDKESLIAARNAHHAQMSRATEEARGKYIAHLSATIRKYKANLHSLAALSEAEVSVIPPKLENDDTMLAQAGLEVQFRFDKKETDDASGGQRVIKSLILLVALLMDDEDRGGFVFVDEPFAHLDILNIDRVSSFLMASGAQYVVTTPITNNANVFNTTNLTLVTQKRRHPDKWAPPIAFVKKAEEKKQKGHKKELFAQGEQHGELVAS
jgi:chromosome segregation ATPase